MMGSDGSKHEQANGSSHEVLCVKEVGAIGVHQKSEKRNSLFPGYSATHVSLVVDLVRGQLLIGDCAPTKFSPREATRDDALPSREGTHIIIVVVVRKNISIL